jgi:Spy/CpxP family protein refolding chaperone
MKRIAIAAALTLIATLAAAQDHMRRIPLEKMNAENSAAIAGVLGLSADQQTQWDAIHQQLALSIMPIKEQIGPAERQLQALADAPSPDATAVGRQFLALRALQQQIRAAHDSAKGKIDALLTPDQKARFDAMHHAMEQGPMMMRHPEGPGSRD